MLSNSTDRWGCGYILLRSLRPPEETVNFFLKAAVGDNTLADAVLDRLMHNAHRLPLNGESMRKYEFIRKILRKLTEGEHLG